MMHLLGAPTTLWSPGSGFDGLHAPVLEGFSIPPTMWVPFETLHGTAPLDWSRERPVPLFDRSLFHPPDVSHTGHAWGKVSVND